MIADLLESKGAQRVSVCLPARNEAATVGDIVRTIVADLVDGVGLVDEVVVVDDGSSDATVAAATAAGAIVASASEVLGKCGPGTGKGEALWKAVALSTGDLIVFCDADIRSFESQFVTRLLEPLLAQPGTEFVKGFYDRSYDGVAGEGGRVTELVARPLISLFFPSLAGIRQPLAGEYAARRDVLERLPFVEGYGVDLGLLIDVAARFGAEAVAQVDLGARLHRNRSLDELGAQALEVMRTALHRAGVRDHSGMPVEAVCERPPLMEVPAYREARASVTTLVTQAAVSACARSTP